MAAARVDDGRPTGGARGVDEGADRRIGQRAAAVVGENERVDIGERRRGIGDQQIADRGRRRAGVLLVDAEKLLPAAEVARLDRGAPAGVGNEVGIETRKSPAQSGELACGIVVAGEPDERHRAAERQDVRGDVASRAHHGARRAVLQHGHWRFARNARHPALDEVVEQDIADHQHPGVGKPVDDRGVHGRSGRRSKEAGQDCFLGL